MTIKEACDVIRTDGKYTDESLKNLMEAFKENPVSDFSDENFKYFVDTVMPLNFDARVQDIVSYISETLAEKGIYPTCHDINGGCSSDCAFHEAEFGKESAK